VPFCRSISAIPGTRMTREIRASAWRWSAGASAGERTRKTSVTGTPSDEKKSMPRRDIPTARTTSESSFSLQCGIASPPPRPVEPILSRSINRRAASSPSETAPPRARPSAISVRTSEAVAPARSGKIRFSSTRLPKKPSPGLTARSGGRLAPPSAFDEAEVAVAAPIQDGNLFGPGVPEDHEFVLGRLDLQRSFFGAHRLDGETGGPHDAALRTGGGRPLRLLSRDRRRHLGLRGRKEPRRRPVLAVPPLLQVFFGLRVDLPEGERHRGPRVGRVFVGVPAAPAMCRDDLGAESVPFVGKHDADAGGPSEMALQALRPLAGQVHQRRGDLHVATGAFDGHQPSVGSGLRRIKNSACVGTRRECAALLDTSRRSAGRSGFPPRGASA